MRYFRKINDFLNESRLQHVYDSLGIPNFVKEPVEEYVDSNIKNAPGETKKQRDRIVLWISKELVKSLKRHYDFYNDGDIKFGMEYTDGKRNSEADKAYFKELGKKGTGTIDQMAKYVTYNLIGRPEYKGIIDWVCSPLRDQSERIDWNNATYQELENKQRAWHEELKSRQSRIVEENGNIIKKYDDGFYWVDLESNCDEEEGGAMGHCGTTSVDTLYSLRGPDMQPHVTVALTWDSDDEDNSWVTVYQIKGKGNTKPVEKYHKYIVDLYMDDEINIQTYKPEYEAWDDFNVFDLTDKNTIIDIIKNKPGLYYYPKDQDTDVDPEILFKDFTKEQIEELLQIDSIGSSPEILFYGFFHDMITDEQLESRVLYTYLIAAKPVSKELDNGRPPFAMLFNIGNRTFIGGKYEDELSVKTELFLSAYSENDKLKFLSKFKGPTSYHDIKEEDQVVYDKSTGEEIFKLGDTSYVKDNWTHFILKVVDALREMYQRKDPAQCISLIRWVSKK